MFDKFNIEFRQADEQIIFTWREEQPTVHYLSLQGSAL